MLVRFYAHFANLNGIQVFFSTSEVSDHVVEPCYYQHEQIHTLPNCEVTFNVKGGKEIEDLSLQNVIGKHGLGDRSERRERLLQICIENCLYIANTRLKQNPRK